MSSLAQRANRTEIIEAEPEVYMVRWSGIVHGGRHFDLEHAQGHAAKLEEASDHDFIGWLADHGISWPVGGCSDRSSRPPAPSLRRQLSDLLTEINAALRVASDLDHSGLLYTQRDMVSCQVEHLETALDIVGELMTPVVEAGR